MVDSDTSDVLEHLRVLRATPGELGDLVNVHDDATLRVRPFADKWTPCEILGHFFDHEIVTACRIRTTRLSDEAWLGRYQQDDWVERQGHAQGDPAFFVRSFTFLRRLNLLQYESLTGIDWDCEVERSDGQGRYTPTMLIKRHADHDLHHLDQLRRYLEAARG